MYLQDYKYTHTHTLQAFRSVSTSQLCLPLCGYYGSGRPEHRRINIMHATMICIMQSCYCDIAITIDGPRAELKNARGRHTEEK